ncbi:hypothetical protein C1H46_042709 [Malus baccata]|uniref:Pentatricopeptide repeat-containing protein n=1 Tax=Malus baccata TaxID=106549 RepID=A0A540KC18_MALBA|nr:hypothetical protein C1H46_042709 [Malus baccata]
MRLRPPPSKALHSFHRKQSLSTFPSESVCQDGAADSHYTHLLQMCLQQCKYIKAHKVFDEMPERLLAHASRTCKTIHARSLKIGIASKGFLGNAILGFYAKCSNVGCAKKAFNCLESKDVFAWNSVLSMYSSKGLVEQVVKLFGSMWNDRVMPNEFTFAMGLSACARLVDVEYGRQVHCGVIKMGFELSSFCEGALIDMYAKGNCISDARQIFDGVLELDTVAWTTMISGLSVKNGLETSLYSGSSLIDMYSKCGVIEDARKAFYYMPHWSVVSVNALIAGFGYNNLEEAVNLLHEMQDIGLNPTEITFSILLDACSGSVMLTLGRQIHSIVLKKGLLCDGDFNEEE